MNCSTFPFFRIFKNLFHSLKISNKAEDQFILKMFHIGLLGGTVSNSEVKSGGMSLPLGSQHSSQQAAFIVQHAIIVSQ